MTGILVPQKENAKPSEPSAQVMEDEVIFKEEHKAIYDAFIQSLENRVQSEELKEDDETVLAFMLSQNQIIFKNVKLEDVKPLSEENFCQLLLSVFKEIREQGLAREEKLNNDKIQQIIIKCVADIRGTEAKDSFIKLAGWPFGIKIDPKNISSSFMNWVKEKIPFLGKDKKEEDEPPLSDEEMVTTFLRKSLFPIIALTTVILLGGLSGPVSVLGLFTIPHVIVIGFAVFGFAAAEYKAVKSLFSNDKKGTLYDPHSQDEKERKEWGNEISDGINTILETPVKRVEKGTPVSEQNSQGNNRENEESKQSTVLEQVTLDQQKTTVQQPNKT
ncbi:hypothetical protein [Wolbachia endosymbiont (group A) of Conops quadrifasciatus]|uniref:hypothetical protein n=1 Tax=Wolbachia endosymbiont (group A) of Conops quadrifasciatus TaxID=3066143 RepID=UPI003132D06A